MDSKAYLRDLQWKAYRSAYHLPYRLMDAKTEEVKERIRRAQDVLAPLLDASPHDQSFLSKIAIGPPWTRLDPLAETLCRSAMKLVTHENREQLKDIAAGFLPTGIFNACCVGGLSNGYVIALNHGMFNSLVLLCIAWIAPSTTGEVLEMAKESVDQQEILAALVKYAMTPNSENYAEVERHYSYMTPELLGLGAAFTSSILVFIVLHEMGHICNGDVDKGVALANFDFDNWKVDYVKPSHRHEYAADQFALNAFLSDSDTTKPALAWAAYAHVEIFFQFLMHVERIGKITESRTHPPAISRLHQLRRMMQARWGRDQIGYVKRVGVQFHRMGKDLRKV